MKLTAKVLQGGECTVEVTEQNTVLELKEKIKEQLNIPIPDQKLLFLGRTLMDEIPLAMYTSLVDGCKMHVVVRKPDGLFEKLVKAYVKKGLDVLEAKNAANMFLRILREKFYKLSWDDIERLSLDCMRDENGQIAPADSTDD